jgi:hypothetical protein
LRPVKQNEGSNECLRIEIPPIAEMFTIFCLGISGIVIFLIGRSMLSTSLPENLYQEKGLIFILGILSPLIGVLILFRVYSLLRIIRRNIFTEVIEINDENLIRSWKCIEGHFFLSLLRSPILKISGAIGMI